MSLVLRPGFDTENKSVEHVTNGLGSLLFGE